MSNVLAGTNQLICRCGHSIEDHSPIGCDRFVVKHEPGKPKNVVKVDFCQCNLKIKDLIKMEHDQIQ